ncbi:MAG: exopolysaccharide biosynthesis protein [Rhodospirillum sp.]|jgi:protein-tyrosine kinase|nr:exopolysaccharide biosynthesis protein [Rhodospirillum sp.]
MEQIERALRKSREQRRTAVGHQNGTAAKIRLTPAATHTQTRCVSLAPSLLDAHRVVSAAVHHPVTDVYRSLRAQVLQALNARDKTTIGITSANHGEGKTLTAVNLAIAMAMDVNHNVLLVDADLRNPGVATCLGLEATLGVSDYLTGDATIADCLVHPRIERLTVLPARNRIGNSAELLASPQMVHLARELKERYADRLIVYDLPPILTVGDAIGFLPTIDATLLVVRDGATRVPDLNRALELLGGYNLIGTVLNGVP